MRYVTKRPWVPLPRGEAFTMPKGSTRLVVRCEGKARVYADRDPDFINEVLVGCGEGEIEMEITGLHCVHVETNNKDHRVWVRGDHIDQTTWPFYGNSYTEPLSQQRLSPEMEAIMRLRRENEIHRRVMTAEFERKLQDERTALRNAAQSGENSSTGVDEPSERQPDTEPTDQEPTEVQGDPDRNRGREGAEEPVPAEHSSDD